jgi:hypothetical protein
MQRQAADIIESTIFNPESAEEKIDSQTAD